MATFKKNKSGGSQSEGGSNSASPASSVALSNAGSTQGINNNAPKYGTLVPNRIFVGGISSNTTEAELSQLFSKYGCVKATKIIADRAGVSKGYGFVTFETEEEVKLLLQDSNNIVFKERRLNVAPAVKKQFVEQPSGRYDSSSPPPTTTPILHFANGVPYTYHNGMAFFPPTAHQPSLAALPPSADHSMYPSYSPAPNTAPAPYGTSVIVPGPPFLMPQNYSYQPLSMTNGAATQFIYPGSGSPSSSSGSPMANTPESHHPVPSVLSQQFFAPQFTPQEAFYPPYYIYSSSASVYTDYELQDQQTNDDRSSTVSSPHSEVSERSGDRSPVIISRMTQRSVERGSNSPRPNPPSTPSNDSQVPVVSWKTYSEEREIYIRDGRRAFHPIVPPAPTPPTPPQHTQMLFYHQTPFSGNFSSPNTVYQHSKSTVDSRNQRPNSRGRPTRIVSSSTIPYIPKFPACFNNNNPLISNNNFHDKMPSDMSNRGNRQGNRNATGGQSRGTNSRNSSPHNPKPSHSSPQMMPQIQPQHFERPTYVMAANSAPRWSNVPQNSMKRISGNKKHNGSNSNLGGNNAVRSTKKIQGEVVEQDVGGGGDAQLAMNRNSPSPAGGNNAELTSKMQALALETSS